ncbi:MAG: hypothetical protein KC964_14660, partial [Candidatus Omnitrophica bacterium]|nr:hypothetical protein [Candidatus Omnitrophota bacterium]
MDGTEPVATFVGIKAGDRSVQENLHFDDGSDTIYFQPTAISTPRPLRILAKAVDPVPAPDRVGSGPWKFVVEKESGYSGEFPADPLEPSEILVDTEDFNIHLYDRAGNMNSNAITSNGPLTVTADCNPPLITAFSVVTSEPLDGEVEVEIEVYEGTPTCGGSAGIRKIEVFAEAPSGALPSHPLYGADPILLGRVFEPPSSLSVFWNTRILPDDDSNYDVDIFATATDNVGNSADSSPTTKEIDNTPDTPIAGASTLTVSNLKTEYQTNPLVIDVPNPRFSWELFGGSGLQQTK